MPNKPYLIKWTASDAGKCFIRPVATRFPREGTFPAQAVSTTFLEVLHRFRTGTQRGQDIKRCILDSVWTLLRAGYIACIGRTVRLLRMSVSVSFSLSSLLLIHDHPVAVFIAPARAEVEADGPPKVAQVGRRCWSGALFGPRTGASYIICSTYLSDTAYPRSMIITTKSWCC